ncbi:hypothetical protein Leryth_025653 [Lithospermum erythrorhizon]|nr:hypothetical protein Leryth_025653 [Lithospermum erythrorhizon]
MVSAYQRNRLLDIIKSDIIKSDGNFILNNVRTTTSLANHVSAKVHLIDIIICWKWEGQKGLFNTLMTIRSMYDGVDSEDRVLNT